MKEKKYVRVMFFIALCAMAFFMMGCPDPEPVQKIFPNEDGTTTIICEENGVGFTSTTGTIKQHASYPGYVGSFIENLGAGSNIIYSFTVPQACNAKIKMHYAFWGTKTEVRAGKVTINGTTHSDFLYFPWTSKNGNNIWQYSNEIIVSLAKGENQIRIEPVAVDVLTPDATFPSDVTVTPPYKASGKLPNVDSLIITATGITAGASNIEYFTISATSNNLDWGTVSVSPVQDYYVEGTEVTLTATAKSGYIFDSWTAKKGTASVPSRNATYIVTATKDFSFFGRFIPENAEQPSGLMGFGAVQDDNATEYIITGGLGGASYTVTSIEELSSALAASDYARTITIAGKLDNWGKPSLSYNVPSNTTIQSDSTHQGHVRNIELKIAGDNIIIQNMIFSEVVASACEIDGVAIKAGSGNDAMQINGARHIWIDHCEFYSSLTFPAGVTSTVEAKDFYDGLLDIKNGSSFITVSNSYFHTHWKAVLCGSGDNDDNGDSGDSEMRLTFYNNYFKNVNSRSPLLRYGKAHLFNNYWHGDSVQIDSTVNARCGAEVFVENNYFSNCKYTIGFFYSTDATTTGTWNVSGNEFSSAPSVSSTTSWKPSYQYGTPVDASELPSTVPNSVGPKL